jgi:hypothetical protein
MGLYSPWQLNWLEKYNYAQQRVKISNPYIYTTTAETKKNPRQGRRWKIHVVPLTSFSVDATEWYNVVQLIQVYIGLYSILSTI